MRTSTVASETALGLRVRECREGRRRIWQVLRGTTQRYTVLYESPFQTDALNVYQDEIEKAKNKH